MIEKIKDLKTEITKEQSDNAWSKVLSHKIRMLEASDWTQLSDVYLSQETKNEWKNWRQNVRKVKKAHYTNSLDAEMHLNSLENFKPANTSIDCDAYNESTSTNNEHHEILNDGKKNVVEIQKVFIKEQPIIIKQDIEEDLFERLFFELMTKNSTKFKQRIRNLLEEQEIIFFDTDTLYAAKEKMIIYSNNIKNELLTKKISEFSSIEILNEKFEQAVDYLTNNNGKIETYSFIKLYSDFYNKTPEIIAEEFVLERKRYNKILIEAEKFFLYIKNKIETSESMEELKSLIYEIKNGY